MADVTVANLFGESIAISGDHIGTVGDALSAFYKGNIPDGVKVQIGGRIVSLDLPARHNDMIIVREGEFARKEDIGGA